MLHWLLPLGSLQTTGGNFTVWFYTHDNSIRKSDKGMGMGFTGMRCGWYVRFLFRPDFLFVWVCYPTADKKKVPGRTLRAMCSPGMKSRQLNNTASDCGRASLGRKHFGLSIFFQSSVSDYFLFQIRTVHTPPQHHLPCLRDGCSQDMPCCHLATLSPGKKWCCFHTMPTAHSLSVKSNLSLIWAVRRQAKQRIWLQSSSLSEQDSWNGIQLTSVGLICSYRVNRVQGVLLKYLKYRFPWMLQKWLYNCSPSGK